MTKYLLVIGICLCTFQVSSQSVVHVKPYDKYDTLLIPYADLGFNSAPLRFKYPFSSELEHLYLRNNPSFTLGLGFAYRWFNLRLGINLPGNLRSTKKYGPTEYYDLGVDFTLKQFFIDADIHLYNGYTYKNAYRWNDTLDHVNEPNLYNGNFVATSLSLNTWHFWNKDFKTAAFRGKTASFNKDVSSFYLKYSISLYGVGAENGLIPKELVDSNQTRTAANSIYSFDIGLIPGYGYVKRIEKWQIGVMGGLGAVVQTKGYITPDVSRSFLGLAFRYDIRFVAGLNEPQYFLMFVTDFDNKSIALNDLKYRQTYYSMRLTGGFRFQKKRHTKTKRD